MCGVLSSVQHGLNDVLLAVGLRQELEVRTRPGIDLFRCQLLEERDWPSAVLDAQDTVLAGLVGNGRYPIPDVLHGFPGRPTSTLFLPIRRVNSGPCPCVGTYERLIRRCSPSSWFRCSKDCVCPSGYRQPERSVGQVHSRDVVLAAFSN